MPVTLNPASVLSTTMAPGGLHVMLIDLRRALVIGDSVRLRLRFSDSTSVAVTAPVQTP